MLAKLKSLHHNVLGFKEKSSKTKKDKQRVNRDDMFGHMSRNPVAMLLKGVGLDPFITGMEFLIK